MSPSAARTGGGSAEAFEIAAPLGAVLLVLSFWLLFRAFPGYPQLPESLLADGRLPANVIGIGGGPLAPTGLVRLAGWAAALTGLATGVVSGSRNLTPGSRAFLLAFAAWCIVAAWLLFYRSPPVAGWWFSGAFFIAFMGLGFGVERSGSALPRAPVELESDDENPAEPVAAAPNPPPQVTKPTPRPTPEPVHTYSCPRCGGAVAGDARISPRGDVRCTSCDSWISLPRADPG